MEAEIVGEKGELRRPSVAANRVQGVARGLRTTAGVNPAGSMPRPATAPPRQGKLALDGAFWRRAALLGATRLPGWFVRWSPPLIGTAIAIASPGARATIRRRLARARGSTNWIQGGCDVVCTFANFASCLTESLSIGSKNRVVPQAIVHRNARAEALLSTSAGIIFATAHTAGWESLGGLLAHEHHRRVMVVVQRERDPGARALQDAIRAQTGVQIVHVGGDPLASLPLMQHLRNGGVVALQIDRVPPHMTGRPVRLFGTPGVIPEGPLRLAQLTGAPIVPVFSSRTGHRRYTVHVCEPVHVARRAGPHALDAAAQELADALGSFVSAHPTQWFAFQE